MFLLVGPSRLSLAVVGDPSPRLFESVKLVLATPRPAAASVVFLLVPVTASLA